MNNAVIYSMSGKPYLPYLVTSLWTLRRHWYGTVVVYSWDECLEETRSIAADNRLGIDVVRQTPEFHGKNAQFTSKITLMQRIDADIGLYLDADTLIGNSPSELFNLAASHGFVGTQFNNWTTAGQIIKNRIIRLRDYPSINQQAVQELLSYAHISLNGGVFACQPNSPVLPLWHEWTLIAANWPNVRDGIFIADETVLHLMPLVFEPTQFAIVEGGRANCSPKYKPRHLSERDVIVWHGHGNCFARPDKSPKGSEMWLKAYRECCELNVGGIATWKEPHCGNRHLKSLFSKDDREVRHERLFSA